MPDLSGAEVDRLPNIVFIFADDLAYNTVGATDTQQPKTPHLDRLAREGTVFTHAYNQGGWHGAICVASRSMLNTGRFLWRAREPANRLDQEQIEGRLWSQYLKEAGYTTFFSGKWHLEADVEDSFDVVKHVRPGMPRDTPQSYNRPRANDPWKAWDKSQGGYWEAGQHWSEVLA
ncbi:MAG: sulfatase-like hydrolase/transferase, partial [Pirellulales bacterium]|nr:sulfatase-like hydrolase/transferase [Pirellulales bacterium]